MRLTLRWERLAETKSAAEVARKNAADKLAVAETELAEVEKQSRDADKKIRSGKRRESTLRKLSLSRWRFISPNLLNE